MPADDDRVGAIAMTGSTNADKRVASITGLVELHMELVSNLLTLLHGQTTSRVG